LVIVVRFEVCTVMTVKNVAFCDALYFGITLPSASAVLSGYTVSLAKTLQPWQSQITVDIFAVMCGSVQVSIYTPICR
jgi:hypothetical protein